MSDGASEWYVYGIVPAGCRVDAECELVESGPIAAVTGSRDRGPGTAEDVRKHDRVVAEFVRRGTPILPIRFGAVAKGQETLARDFLDPNVDMLERALAEVTGRVQYTVRIGYIRDAVVRAVSVQDPAVAAARAAVGEDPSHGAQVRLGEVVIEAINRRRAGDAAKISAALEPHADRVRSTPATDPDRLGDVAALVLSEQAEAFEAAVEDLAARHADALTVKLIGPIAAYDFVPGL